MKLFDGLDEADDVSTRSAQRSLALRERRLVSCSASVGTTAFFVTMVQAGAALERVDAAPEADEEEEDDEEEEEAGEAANCSASTPLRK